MKFPVLEIFSSIQGEGMYTGVPSIFVRVAGCNLRCVFGSSRCDTPYSSFELEKPKWNEVEDVYNKIHEELIKTGIKHLVITGGEPLLYSKQIKELVTKIKKNISEDIVVTIETNGTLPVIKSWISDEKLYSIDLWSISPKLSTSVDNTGKFLSKEESEHHNKTRINIDNLTSYYEEHLINGRNKIQTKFVYTNEDSVTEIKQLIKQVQDSLGVIEMNILLMPEGMTNDALKSIQEECAKVCIRENWRFCDRLHIRIWGDRREV